MPQTRQSRQHNRNDFNPADTRALRLMALDEMGSRRLLVPTVTGFQIADGVVKPSPQGKWAKAYLSTSKDDYVKSIVPEKHLLLGYCLFKIANAPEEKDPLATSEYFNIRLGSLIAELSREKVPANAAVNNWNAARYQKSLKQKARKAAILQLFEDAKADSKMNKSQLIAVTIKRFKEKYSAKRPPSVSAIYCWLAEKR